MKKLTMLILLVSVIALLYGCCSHSKDSFYINPQGDMVITSRDAVIDELGRLPTITFPSGAKIEGLEENTLTPGIVVTVTEQKISPQSNAYFNDYSDSYFYVYKITAVQTPENPLESKTYVTTTEKPLKITLPQKSNTGGITFAGIKESSTDPWRIFNNSESTDITAVIEGVNIPDVSPNDNTFNLFRLGTEFAVFKYQGNTGNKLPETFVSSLTATSTVSVLVKDGKYLEDIQIKGVLKGIKLDSIKPTDLRARITYRNNLENEAPIKLNGASINQTSKADKTVPGYTYYHCFEVDSLSDCNLMSTDGEFTFTLNTAEIAIDSFPAGFLIEFYNKVDSEKILPYNYTEFYNVSTTESVTLVLSSDDGSIADEANNLYQMNPTFTITSSYEFSDTDKEKIAEAVSVSNIAPEKLIKIWNGRTMTLSFAEPLQPNTLYTISIEEITDLEGAVISPFEEFSFSTINDQTGTYSIVYELAGGVATPANPTTYGKASDTFTLTNPTKEGYTFIGWTGTGLDSASMTLTIPQGSTGNKEFTANYNPITYSIVYNLEGGEPNADNPVTYDITSATIVLQTPTRQGYAFTGWTGSNGDEPQIAVTIEQGSTGDKEFTAHYTVVDYTITYNLGGDNVINNNPLGYNTGSETFSLTEPLKDGYTFIGWTGSNGDVPQLAVTIGSGSIGDRTYTANFILTNYTITYNNVDGCAFASENPASYDITSATITLNNPNKDGYTFTGWTGSNGDVPQLAVTIESGSSGDRAYTANFSLINYTITYNSVDGCSFSSANPESYDITSATITLNAPTRTGCEFLGWTGSNGDTPQTFVSIQQGSSGNKAFTANWDLTINLAIAPNDDMIINEVVTPNNDFPFNYANDLYYTKSAFTVTPTLAAGVVLNDTEKSKILSAISIKDSSDQTVASDSISTAWTNDGKIALTFNNHLNASTTYTISFDDVDGMTLNHTAFTFKTFYFKGRGTDDNRYQVETPAQLNLVKYFLTKHYVQTTDIDIGSYIWYPIFYIYNNNYDELFYTAFTGSYYGNGKKIKNLKFRNLNYVDCGVVGLFGVVEKNNSDANSGKIASVTIESFSIRSSDSDPDASYIPHYHEAYFDDLGGARVGLITYFLGENCIIENCKVTDITNGESSIISENDWVNGICYEAIDNSLIKNCNVENLTINNAYGCGICSFSTNNNISQCNVTNFNCINGGGCGICNYSWYGNISQCNVTNYYIKNGNGDGICSQFSGGNLTECNVSSFSVIIDSPINSVFCASSGISGILVDAVLSQCNVKNYTFRGGPLENIVGGISSFANNSNISNCNVTEAIIENTDNTGGICYSFSGGNISQCKVTDSTIKVSRTGGGICANINLSNSFISNCYLASCTIEVSNVSTSSEFRPCFIGGIFGQCTANNVSINNCYLTNSTIKASVTGPNSGFKDRYLGGICGYSTDGLSNCYISKSSINVTCASDCKIGGICGYSSDGLSNCYVLNSSIDIPGSNSRCYIGGICASSSGEISQSYIKDSTIKASITDLTNVGGIIGETMSVLSNCYALNTKVEVTSNNNNNIGGIIGKLSDQSNLSSCYFYYDKDNESPVILTSNYNNNKLGLLAGIDSSSSSIIDCFTNKVGTLVGESTGTIDNSYDGVVNYSNFNGKTWTANAWDSYIIDNSTNWPPNITALPRGN